MLHDVAIVGGGPAGLTAGIWLGRYLHSVVLIDSGDPRNWETRGVNGFLSRPHIRPADLRAHGRDDCRRFGVQLVDGCVARAIKESDDHFLLLLENGSSYEARRLLLAFGLRDVWPDIHGLEHAYGDNVHVCPDCDGYEARNRKTVVIGSGRRATGMALGLTTWTPHIVICTNGRPADLDASELETLQRLNIPILDARVRRLHPRTESNGSSLEFEDGIELDFDHLFFTISQYPADDLGRQLGCERDENDQIVVDDAHHTSVKNVFAAGDIIPGPQIAIRAAAGGAVAGMAIHKSLLPDQRRMP